MIINGNQENLSHKLAFLNYTLTFAFCLDSMNYVHYNHYSDFLTPFYSCDL